MQDTEFYRYNGKRRFNIKKFNTKSTGEFSNREEAVDEFVENLLFINKTQQKLYAERKEGVVFIFQAMDAAGKDGVIRTVFSTLSPHGVKEYCFKVPSNEEKAHDFLWRFAPALPPRGCISIFNRSYYESVLVEKVHKFYEADIVPDRVKHSDLIRDRYRQVNAFEKYLYSTGTRVVKIFLNISKDEQARRFISRIDTPKKNWKVSPGDIREREYWDDYMEAFEKMVNSTSTERSPWYVVPADHKWFARLMVSRIVRKTLEEIDPSFPPVEEEAMRSLTDYRTKLIDSMEKKDEIRVEKQMPEFANTGVISADIVQYDEMQKISEEEQTIKDNGFAAIRKLLAKSCIVHSMADIMKAVAEEEGEEEDPTEEEDEIPVLTSKEVRDHFKGIGKDDEEDK